MRGRYRTTMALIGVMGLTVAACGSDDAETTETTAPATTAAPTTVAEEPDADDTAADESAAADEPEPEPAEEPADLPLVVATTSIWGDVVDNVVCHTLAEVEVVVPPGADAHFYEASLADRALMGGADIVIANGLFYEEGLLATLEAVAADGVPVFEVTSAIGDPLEFEGGHGHGHSDDDGHGHDDDHGHGHDDDHGHSHDDDHGHSHDDDHGHSHDDDKDGHGHDDHGHGDHGHAHDGDDPHVWFDPARVAAALPMLGEAIVDATGIDGAAVADCVAAYQDELMALDAEIVDTLSVIDDDVRILVTSHESLGYFADRYDFEILGTVLSGTSSLAETNPARLQELADEVRASGVPAVFAEAESSSADIEAMARAADVEVVLLPTESLGEPGTDSDTYVGFLRTNAVLIAEALS